MTKTTKEKIAKLKEEIEKIEKRYKNTYIPYPIKEIWIKKKAQLSLLTELSPQIEKETIENIIERAKNYNGLINTEDNLFQHIERLQKCLNCGKDFWDKICLDCINKKENKVRQEVCDEIQNSNWIADRIETEFKKHYLHGLRFEKIAEAKIKANLIANIKDKISKGEDK